MCSPACASSGSSPAVFSATVLPPVFGPVMTSTWTGGISRMSTGTGSRTLAGLPIGRSSARRWPTPQSLQRRDQQRMPGGAQLEPAVLGNLGRRRRRSREARPRLQHVESGRRVHRPVAAPRARPRNASVSASRMRWTSSCSCCSSATMSLLISTVLSGSRNRLAPLPELPCTMPGIDRGARRGRRARNGRCDR